MNWGFSEDSRPCLGTWNPPRGQPVVLCLASPSVGSMNSCCFHSSVSKKPEVRNQLLSWCPILLPPASLPKDTAKHTHPGKQPSISGAQADPTPSPLLLDKTLYPYSGSSLSLFTWYLRPMSLLLFSKQSSHFLRFCKFEIEESGRLCATNQMEIHRYLVNRWMIWLPCISEGN